MNKLFKTGKLIVAWIYLVILNLKNAVVQLFSKKKSDVPPAPVEDLPEAKEEAEPVPAVVGVDQIVKALDELHSSNEDIYTKIAVLVSDIHDVSVATGDNKDKQKKDLLATLQEITKAVKEL